MTVRMSTPTTARQTAPCPPRMLVPPITTAAIAVSSSPVAIPGYADPAREGELKRLYIHSDFQGRGLGRGLLDLALAHLTQRYGAAAQWIGVWSRNHKAQKLYASAGFEKVGDYLFAVGNTRDAEFILRKAP